jgi:hypothetical protein
MAVLGDDFVQACESLVAARREAKEADTPWYRRIVGDTGKAHIARCLKRGTLSQLQQAGYMAEDIVEAGLDMSVLDRFTPSELKDFGFTFPMLLSLGLGGKHLRRFSWRELQLFGLKAEDIFNLSTTVHDILAMDLTVQQLHTMGFTRNNLTGRGGTQEMLEGIFGAEDTQMYLGGAPTLSVPRASMTFEF